MGKMIKENKIIPGQSTVDTALNQGTADLGPLCDLRQTNPPLWALNSMSMRLMEVFQTKQNKIFISNRKLS